jgi:hypothetical protein
MNEQTSNPGVHYERKDIRFGCLLAALIAGMCVLATVGYVTWKVLWFQASEEYAAKRSSYPLSPGLSKTLPPEPRLEQIDRMARTSDTDVGERLAAKERVLNSFGPADEKGFVHVPIEKAINSVAGSLPVRKQNRPRKEGRGLLDSGEPNSGRMFRGETP